MSWRHSGRVWPAQLLFCHRFLLAIRAEFVTNRTWSRYPRIDDGSTSLAPPTIPRHLIRHDTANKAIDNVQSPAKSATVPAPVRHGASVIVDQHQNRFVRMAPTAPILLLILRPPTGMGPIAFYAVTLKMTGGHRPGPRLMCVNLRLRF